MIKNCIDKPSFYQILNITTLGDEQVHGLDVELEFDTFIPYKNYDFQTEQKTMLHIDSASISSLLQSFP